MSDSVNEAGKEPGSCAVPVQPISVREAREAGRLAELWMHQNIDAPDDAHKVASMAWRAMQVAAVPDNHHPFTQDEHRGRMRAFAEMTAAWPIIG